MAQVDDGEAGRMLHRMSPSFPSSWQDPVQGADEGKAADDEDEDEPMKADEDNTTPWSSLLGEEAMPPLPRRSRSRTFAAAVTGSSSDMPTSAHRISCKGPVAHIKVRGLSDDDADDDPAPKPANVFMCSGYKCNNTSGKFTIMN